MNRLSDILAIIESIAPPALQESYDNSGLLVGDGNMEINKTLLALDCTEAVVEEAISKGCNLVIAHHPIVFSGLKRFTGGNYVQRTIAKAIKHDIAIYACHTNLDNVLKQGVNQRIAAKLGLTNGRVLEEKENQFYKLVTFIPLAHVEKVQNSVFAAGAGQIGNYAECGFTSEGKGTFKATQGAAPYVGNLDEQHTEAEYRWETVFPRYLKSAVLGALRETHPYEEVAFDLYPVEQTSAAIGAGWIGEYEHPVSREQFLARLKSAFGLSVVRYTASANDNISKVAICGGSGSFLTRKALQAGAHAYVTADVKYHEFFDAEGRMMICDIGHWESEQYTTEIFYEVLREKITNFAAIFADTKTNPVNYYF